MAEEYSARITDVVNSGSVAFMMSLAKDTGILTALKDALQPLTSQEIADLKGLKERYVREILGCLACAKLVRLETSDTGETSYFLTDEEKKGLEHEVNWPFLSIPRLFASKYNSLKGLCDAKGPYGFYYSEEAHEVLEEISIRLTEPNINTMLTNIAGLKERLETGIDVIEFGCGSGQLLASLATSYPKSRFTASDVAPELVDKLRGKWGHLANMSFEIHNLCRLGETMPKKYDWVYSINVIHDLSKPQEALDGMRGIVEEGNGVCSVIEPCMSQTGAHAESVGNSAVAAFYGVSTFMCVPASFQEDDSVALGMCVGKKGIVDRLLKAKFKVEDFKARSLFALYVCTPV